jgi:hypothetical protein
VAQALDWTKYPGWVPVPAGNVTPDDIYDFFIMEELQRRMKTNPS